MARPTKYKEEYIEKAKEYLDTHQDIVEVVSDGIPTKKVKLPTIEGFARFLDVNKTTLYEWEKDHPEFSNALSKIKTEQQERLINNGLSGDYNPTIAKLILSSNHGMREKTDVTSDEKPIVPIIGMQIIREDDNKS